MKAHTCNEHSSVLHQHIHEREHVTEQSLNSPDAVKTKSAPVAARKVKVKVKRAKRVKIPVTAPATPAAGPSPTQPEKPNDKL